MSIEAGSVYGNRYRLRERIAIGGMGEVWQATDGTLGRTVAIKLLSPNLAQQPGFPERFRDEARHTALLGHPNIATVYDYGEDNGASWLVMEYVQGQPLSQIIRDEGPQSPRRTAMIIGQCADALQAAHEAGVIHRDVKPANILVRPDGVVKLTDFGIARAVDAAPMTRTGEVMGTAQYISPEQAMGRPVSGSSDLYSLGCVAFELLTGRRPFDEGSAVATAMAHVHKPTPPLPAGVPAAMAAVIASCLAKDPEHRPASAKALANAMKGGPAAAAAAVPPGFQSTQVMGAGAAATQHLTSPVAYAQQGTGATHPTGNGYPVAPPPTGTGATVTQGARPGRNRSAPWLWVLFAVLAVAALFAVLRMTNMIGGGSPVSTPSTSISSIPQTTSSTSAATSTTTTTTAAVISITAEEYVGKDHNWVKGVLDASDLRVQESSEYSADVAKDKVIRIDTGSFSPGDTVKLVYSLGPEQPSTTSSAPPPTSSATTPAPPQTPAPTGSSAG